MFLQLRKTMFKMAGCRDRCVRLRWMLLFIACFHNENPGRRQRGC
jgi:hypothetical protein